MICSEKLTSACSDNHFWVCDCIEGKKDHCHSPSGLSKDCLKNLDELLVNFKPQDYPFGGFKQGDLSLGRKSSSVQSSCEEAEKRHRLKQGNSAQCTTALEIVSAGKNDIEKLKECAEGGNFCAGLFLDSMSPKCRNVARNYIEGIN